MSAWLALRPSSIPDVLAVERLEIVEPDGQPAFVFANSERPAVATMDGVLDCFDLRWHDDAALTVVMATEGYPGDVEKGSTIGGLFDAGLVDGVTIFHAGTRQEGGDIIANGGRVLNITAHAPTLRQAVDRAYEAIDRIDWPDGFCRRDIAWRALARE